MSKSILTIHKEIYKKEYYKSPLGILEKKLGKFYEDMRRKKVEVPKETAQAIIKIREDNEKAQQDYIEESQKRDREKVDEILFNSMQAEWDIISKFQINDE